MTTRKQRRIIDRDCRIIIRVLHQNGYEITRDQAYKMWKHYSNELRASWLTLPHDHDRIMNVVTRNGFVFHNSETFVKL